MKNTSKSNDLNCDSGISKRDILVRLESEGKLAEFPKNPYNLPNL